MPSAIKANTNNDLIISYFVTETDLNLINLSAPPNRVHRCPCVGERAVIIVARRMDSRDNKDVVGVCCSLW